MKTKYPEIASAWQVRIASLKNLVATAEKARSESRKAWGRVMAVVSFEDDNLTAPADRKIEVGYGNKLTVNTQVDGFRDLIGMLELAEQFFGEVTYSHDYAGTTYAYREFHFPELVIRAHLRDPEHGPACRMVKTGERTFTEDVYTFICS